MSRQALSIGNHRRTGLTLIEVLVLAGYLCLSILFIGWLGARGMSPLVAITIGIVCSVSLYGFLAYLVSRMDRRDADRHAVPKEHSRSEQGK